MTVVMNCMLCGRIHEVEVDFDAYVKWEEGMTIQNAMPNLTPTEREQLISHICPKCQKSIFGEEDEQGLDTQPLVCYNKYIDKKRSMIWKL